MACIVKSFILNFYPVDNAIEVFDKKTKRIFMRRSRLDEITESDFFIGAKIDVFGREYSIIDYGDDKTKDALTKRNVKTFIVVKTGGLPQLGIILEALTNSGFTISQARMIHLNPEQAKTFLGSRLKADAESTVLLSSLTSGRSAVFEIASVDAIKKLQRSYMRDPSFQSNREVAPLLALLENDEIIQNLYCPETDERAEKGRAYLFGAATKLTNFLTLQNTTLAIIKPHIIKEGKLGKIIHEIITNGYTITCLRLLRIERVNCEEFFEVYRGILPEYISVVAQLASGPCMALELLHEDSTKETQAEFRKFCGPVDPDIGRLLRPHTIRAKFGVSKPLNAIHCTDLADDTFMELQYMFNILD